MSGGCINRTCFAMPSRRPWKPCGIRSLLFENGTAISNCTYLYKHTKDKLWPGCHIRKCKKTANIKIFINFINQCNVSMLLQLTETEVNVVFTIFSNFCFHLFIYKKCRAAILICVQYFDLISDTVYSCRRQG